MRRLSELPGECYRCGWPVTPSALAPPLELAEHMPWRAAYRCRCCGWRGDGPIRKGTTEALMAGLVRLGGGDPEMRNAPAAATAADPTAGV